MLPSVASSPPNHLCSTTTDSTSCATVVASTEDCEEPERQDRHLSRPAACWTHSEGTLRANSPLASAIRRTFLVAPRPEGANQEAQANDEWPPGDSEFCLI